MQDKLWARGFSRTLSTTKPHTKSPKHFNLKSRSRPPQGQYSALPHFTPCLHTNGFKLGQVLNPGHTTKPPGPLPAPSAQFVLPIATIYQKKMHPHQLCAAAKAAPANFKVPLISAPNLMVTLPAQDQLYTGFYSSSGKEQCCQTFGLNDNDFHLRSTGVAISRLQRHF